MFVNTIEAIDKYTIKCVVIARHYFTYSLLYQSILTYYPFHFHFLSLSQSFYSFYFITYSFSSLSFKYFMKLFALLYMCISLLIYLCFPLSVCPHFITHISIYPTYLKTLCKYFVSISTSSTQSYFLSLFCSSLSYVHFH